MTLTYILLQAASSSGAASNFDSAIKLPKVANESTHFLASQLMDIVQFITRIFGLSGDEAVVSVLYVALVVAIAVGIGAIVKWLALGIVSLVSSYRPNSFLSLCSKGNFFNRLTRIIPPLVVLVLVQVSLSSSSLSVKIFDKFLWIYIVVCICMSLSSLTLLIWKHVDSRENKKRLPLKGVAQIVRVLILTVAAIIIVSIIVNKSPATLLAGLGAFAAVLMLIFKDPILGVVAGVQLSENDMLRVGDWIEVEGTSANGNVAEVSLTTVKVLNWDKTTTSLPPYSLISGPFKNYRTMQQSNTRRICRTYLIDADTVRFTDDAMLASIRKVPFMDNYISRKLIQKRAGMVENVNNSEGLVDGTVDTNLGLFRAYVKMYLDSLSGISHEDTCFVNTLQQTQGGIPLQIYCFTSTASWIPYEGIKSEIFEHIAAMMPRFDLYVFENASGRDEINNGVLEAGGSPSSLFGLPYPAIAESPAASAKGASTASGADKTS